jgi:hypothetical protein
VVSSPAVSPRSGAGGSGSRAPDVAGRDVRAALRFRCERKAGIAVQLTSVSVKKPTVNADAKSVTLPQLSE